MKFGTYLLQMGLLFSLISFCPSYGYDPMDPNGNITIKWDVLEWSGGNAYSSRVSIYNYQLYRQVGSQEWRYGWSWQKKGRSDQRREGEQGDCSKFSPRPHSFVRLPVMVDLLPGTPYNMQTQNCCKGGLLSAVAQDPSRHSSAFTVRVGNFPANSTPEFLSVNHTLGLPGYSCGEPIVVPPTRSTTNGRWWTQAASKCSD